MSLGTGRPIVLRDEGSIRHCRALLGRPMNSVTDVRLVSLVELIAQKSKPISQTSSHAVNLIHPSSSNLRDSNVYERTSEPQYVGLHPSGE